MRKINLAFETPQISINGIVFDVLRSDAAVIQDMLDIDDQFKGADISDPATVLQKNGVMLAYLDKLLGSGAVDKITASVPGLAKYGLGMAGLDSVLMTIVEAAGKAYKDGMSVKYGD